MPRGRARIALIKRPINEPIEKHRRRARKHHANNHQEQNSPRGPPVRRHDERAESKGQRKNRVRKTNQPQKSRHRSATPDRLNVSICHRSHAMTPSAFSPHCSRLVAAIDFNRLAVRVNRPYLLLTICGARSFTSSRALTFWICAACSLTCAVRTPTSFLSSLIVASCFAALDFSCPIVVCCLSTLRCSLRNSLSNIAFTAS